VIISLVVVFVPAVADIAVVVRREKITVITIRGMIEFFFILFKIYA
jgi:hypothetical protein